MSYVRFSDLDLHGYDSGIYIYDDVAGGITCCGCELAPSDGRFNCATNEEMVAHVEEHIRAGDAVPDFVIPRLRDGQNFN